MEKERINQETASRIIQQKQNHGTNSIVDNRPCSSLSFLANPTAQRISEEDEEIMQGKFDFSVQRMEDEDEETLQGKFEHPVQRVSEEDEDTLQGKFDKPIKKKNETGMPDNLKAGIESLSGFSMDDVRVHYNSSKPATVQALAYTQGTDIHVAPGQEKHLPHEAWHVAQQMSGRVPPTTSINGMPVNDNAVLEHEADVMGEKAVQMKAEKIQAQNSVQGRNDIMQRVSILVNPKNRGFYDTIIGALNSISNEWVVDGVIKAFYLNSNGKPEEKAQKGDHENKADNSSNNWGDIYISSGKESAFCAGELCEGSQNLKLEMNIQQCEEMYFGNDIDTKVSDLTITPDHLKGNVGVASTLLHELGHAYQHYLKIKNKDIRKYAKFKEYPLLREKLLNPSIDDVSKPKIGDKQGEDLLLEHVNSICPEGMSESDNDFLEADNLYVNEIPYNSTHKYNGGKMGVRRQYCDAITPELMKIKRDYMMIFGFLKSLRNDAIDKCIKEREKEFMLTEYQQAKAMEMFISKDKMCNAIDNLFKHNKTFICHMIYPFKKIVNMTPDDEKELQAKGPESYNEKVKFLLEKYYKGLILDDIRTN